MLCCCCYCCCCFFNHVYIIVLLLQVAYSPLPTCFSPPPSPSPPSCSSSILRRCCYCCCWCCFNHVYIFVLLLRWPIHHRLFVLLLVFRSRLHPAVPLIQRDHHRLPHPHALRTLRNHRLVVSGQHLATGLRPRELRRSQLPTRRPRTLCTRHQAAGNGKYIIYGLEQWRFTTTAS